MVLDRKNKTIEHKIFKDIIDYLEPGDCLVRNNTKVIPARLYGVKEETGANVEFLLLKKSRWRHLGGYGKTRQKANARSKSGIWKWITKSRNFREV